MGMGLYKTENTSIYHSLPKSETFNTKQTEKLPITSVSIRTFKPIEKYCKSSLEYIRAE